MKRHGKINYPDFINACAAYVGKLRNLYNYDLQQKCHNMSRGDSNERVAIIGLMGELIFSHYLHSKGIKHTLNKILDNKPVVSWDIKISENCLIDVKTKKTDKIKRHFLVNKKGHHKEGKNVTHYVFIILGEDNNAEYFIFDKAEISKWEIINVKYSDAYSLDISEYKKNIKNEA